MKVDTTFSPGERRAELAVVRDSTSGGGMSGKKHQPDSSDLSTARRGPLLFETANTHSGDISSFHQRTRCHCQCMSECTLSTMLRHHRWASQFLNNIEIGLTWEFYLHTRWWSIQLSKHTAVSKTQWNNP